MPTELKEDYGLNLGADRDEGSELIKLLRKALLSFGVPILMFGLFHQIIQMNKDLKTQG